MPDLERFWAKVDTSGECWEWTGQRDRNGYGRFSLGRTWHRATRALWALTRGPIPAGMCVLHRCDNPPCVRPDHLWLGSRRDNSRDMAAKRRVAAQVHPETAARGERHGTRTRPESVARGARNGMAKLDPEMVAGMRRLRSNGWSYPRIAASVGIAYSTARAAIIGQTWGDS